MVWYGMVLSTQALNHRPVDDLDQPIAAAAAAAEADGGSQARLQSPQYPLARQGNSAYCGVGVSTMMVS